MSAIFIAVEGLDGSGGTTQTRLLADWFRERGHNEVATTSEPSTGPVGRFIRTVLDPEHEASVVGDAVLPFLFAGDRRDHLDREVIPTLQRGAAVITDRYYHSSLAYQSLAIGLPAVAALNERFRPPDVTVFLDLEPEESLARILARGASLERFEALDRLRAIYEAYEAVLVHCRARGEHIVRIDARGSIEEVHYRVVAAVEATMESMA
ncbi:MAG: dTMP kinase [Myxococcota bacterium]